MLEAAKNNAIKKFLVGSKHQILSNLSIPDILASTLGLFTGFLLMSPRFPAGSFFSASLSILLLANILHTTFWLALLRLRLAPKKFAHWMLKYRFITLPLIAMTELLIFTYPQPYALLAIIPFLLNAITSIPLLQTWMLVWGCCTLLQQRSRANKIKH